MLSKEKLLEKYNIESVCEQFDAVYDEAKKEFSEKGVFYLTREFVEKLQNEYGFFKSYYDFVLEMIDRVNSDEDLRFFSLVIYRMLEYNRGKSNIKMFPRKPLEDVRAEVDFEFSFYFAELAFVPKMAEFYMSRGLPKNYLKATLTDVFDTASIYAYSLTAGRLGFNIKTYFDWNQYYIYYKIVKIGELNFEIDRPLPEGAVALRNKNGEYKILADGYPISSGGKVIMKDDPTAPTFTASFRETEDSYCGHEVDSLTGLVQEKISSFPKEEWEIALTSCDDVLHVHIPRCGKITAENNERAYAEAILLHKKLFPEYNFKAICCSSWLLASELLDMLPEGSSIVAFQKKYHKLPKKARKPAVCHFLFPKPEEDFEKLEETTSLQRKVKAYYLSGGGALGDYGVIFPDEVDMTRSSLR